MPQLVQEKKKSMNIGIAIFSIIVSLIPVIVLLCTGLSSFKTPYGIYSLVNLGICLYFSCIFAFLGKHKILYILLDTITIIASFGLMVYSYINSSYQSGLLLHISAALLFALGMYQTGDADQDDSYYMRYLVPIAIAIAGLIFILWLHTKMSITIHIVIVSIINFFTLSIFLIPSLFKLFKKGSKSFEDLKSEQIEYEDETEEERAERKEMKKAKAEYKKQQANYKRTGQISADGTIDPTRWYVWPNDIDYILRDVIQQYNKIIDQINEDIRDNNKILRSDYSYGFEIKKAGNSNKDVKSTIRYMKRQLKTIKKNLEKLRKRVFTAKDKYKAFDYYVLKGKLKSKKSNQESPTLHIMSFRVYSSYDSAYLTDCKVEIVFDGVDAYLKH